MTSQSLFCPTCWFTPPPSLIFSLSGWYVPRTKSMDGEKAKKAEVGGNKKGGGELHLWESSFLSFHMCMSLCAVLLHSGTLLKVLNWGNAVLAKWMKRGLIDLTSSVKLVVLTLLYSIAFTCFHCGNVHSWKHSSKCPTSHIYIVVVDSQFAISYYNQAGMFG